MTRILVYLGLPLELALLETLRRRVQNLRNSGRDLKIYQTLVSHSASCLPLKIVVEPSHMQRLLLRFLSMIQVLRDREFIVIVNFLPSLIFPLMPTAKVNMNFFSKSVAVTMVSFGMALPNSYSLLMAVFLMLVVSYACCRAVLNWWCTVSCLKVSFTDSWFRLAHDFSRSLVSSFPSGHRPPRVTFALLRARLLCLPLLQRHVVVVCNDVACRWSLSSTV